MKIKPIVSNITWNHRTCSATAQNLCSCDVEDLFSYCRPVKTYDVVLQDVNMGCCPLASGVCQLLRVVSALILAAVALSPHQANHLNNIHMVTRPLIGCQVYIFSLSQQTCSHQKTWRCFLWFSVTFHMTYLIKFVLIRHQFRSCTVKISFLSVIVHADYSRLVRRFPSHHTASQRASHLDRSALCCSCLELTRDSSHHLSAQPDADDKNKNGAVRRDICWPRFGWSLYKSETLTHLLYVNKDRLIQQSLFKTG